MYKCYFIVFVLIASPPAIITDDCDGWKAYEGMCYYFSNETMKLSRDDANSWCEKNKGVLATISNVNINDYIYGQINTKGFHWIGLASTDGSQRDVWRWLDGDMVDSDLRHSMYWGRGEPSGEPTVCAKFGVNNERKFANSNCAYSLKFICESDKTMDGWVTRNNGHSYKFTTNNQNFIQAMNECSRVGAYLARISNISEFTFIKNKMVEYQEYWIGLTTLYWLDGSPINWLNIKDTTNINMNKPCVYFHSTQNKWEATESANCATERKFICQRAQYCEDGWRAHDGLCYYISEELLSQADAITRCEEEGAALVSVPNEDINDFLVNSTGNENGKYWIGLVGTDKPQNKDNWQWLNGRLVNDLFWYSDEPSGNSTSCGHIGKQSLLLRSNIQCDEKLLSICESETNAGNPYWTAFGGHAYRVYNFADTFFTGTQLCILSNAYLTIIESVEELDFIQQMVASDENYWVGLTTLHWLDGSPMVWNTFSAFSGLHGNNPCVYITRRVWKSASDCAEVQNFICQKEMSVQTEATFTASTSTTRSLAISKTVTQTTNINIEITTSSQHQMLHSKTNNAASEYNDHISTTRDYAYTTDSDFVDATIGVRANITPNHDTYIIVGVLVAILVVSGVIVTVTLLIRRRKLKTKEHVYYNNTAVLGNEANQGVNYINTQSGSTRMDHDSIQNTLYEDVDFEGGDGVTSTRPHAARSSTSDYLGASYQGLSFDTHASQNAQNIVTYQELALE